MTDVTFERLMIWGLLVPTASVAWLSIVLLIGVMLGVWS